MTDRLGHFPFVAELAQFMNLEIDDVLDALQTSQARYGLSLDGPTNHAESGTETLGEVLGAEDEHYHGRTSESTSRPACADRLTHDERRLPFVWDAISISARSPNVSDAHRCRSRA